jgi:putative ABC transport system substrate-binding protein
VVLVENVVVIGFTFVPGNPRRGNDEGAVALARAGLAHLQAVQAAMARSAPPPPKTRVVRVGFLGTTWYEQQQNLRLFHERLAALGWVRGQNLVMEYRIAADRPQPLPELAAELVRERVDVIVASGQAAAEAAKAATATAGTAIPVVFLLKGDPLAAGLVPSLAQPGANVTGIGYPPMRGSPPSGWSCWPRRCRASGGWGC